MRHNIIILVDMDGPLADFEGEFLKVWRERYPDVPYVALDDRSTFKIQDQYPVEFREKVEEIYTAPGFIENLRPTPGALDFVQAASAQGHDIFICTSALSLYDPCVLEKYRWVEKHISFEFTKRIITTKDKTLVIGDILIDDKPHISGIRTPVWKHVVFDAPYNRDISHRYRVKNDWSNWEEICKLFET